MNNHPSIRRFFAGVCLLLFSFCVTPKRFLHDLLANHRDVQVASGDRIHYNVSGFHCHIDDLVVVEPFLASTEFPVTAELAFTPVRYAEPAHVTVFSFLPHTDLRGPPAGFCS